MTGVATGVGAGVSALVWSTLVTMVSAVAIARALTRSRPAHSPAVPVLACPAVLVRPCAGDEPWLDDTLGSILRARRSFPVAVRFAVGTLEDPAVPAIHRAVEALGAAGLDARMVVTHATGPNHKSAQLAHVLESRTGTSQGVTMAHRAAVILVADSDVDLTGTDLDALIAPLSDTTVAASWASPVETVGRTLADRASAAVLGGSLHAFPLLAGLDPDGMVGKLMALRGEALHTVGGFGALTGHLGEDMELARRLRAHGGRVTVAPVLAHARVNGRGWRTVIARYARWLAVIRAQRPALLPSYPFLFTATPWIVALGLVGYHNAPRAAVTAIVMAVGTRVSVALAAARATGRPVGAVTAVTDAVLADAVLTLAFFRAVSTRRIAWRGRLLSIEAGGTLRELHPASQASARSARVPSGSDGARSTEG